MTAGQVLLADDEQGMRETLTDILSADALNALLNQLKDAHTKGQRAPGPELDDDMLKKMDKDKDGNEV